jgi:hypothetical protein
LDTQGDAFFNSFPTGGCASRRATATLTGLADGPARIARHPETVERLLGKGSRLADEELVEAALRGLEGWSDRLGR